MAMIEIQHVSKWYGENFQVLKDCTASVETVSYTHLRAHETSFYLV